MQKDEDVGKIAMEVPIMICKLFFLNFSVDSKGLRAISPGLDTVGKRCSFIEKWENARSFSLVSNTACYLLV